MLQCLEYARFCENVEGLVRTAVRGVFPIAKTQPKEWDRKSGKRRDNPSQ